MAILKTITVFIFGFVAISIFGLFSVIIESESPAFDWDVMSDIAKYGVYYAVTVVGIISSGVLRKFDEKGSDSSPPKFQKSEIIVESTKALILSPIVFGTALASIGKDANFFMTVMFAYQNGFFWDAVLKKAKGGS